MSVRDLLWLSIGIATGVTHAVALWRATHASDAPGWSALWRLPVVAAVLVLSVLARSLPAAVIGWATGLTLTSVRYLAGRRRWK